MRAFKKCMTYCNGSTLDNKEPSIIITIFIIYKSHISKIGCAENYVLLKRKQLICNRCDSKPSGVSV